MIIYFLLKMKDVCDVDIAKTYLPQSKLTKEANKFVIRFGCKMVLED